jgi:hypothetical protein
MKETFVKLFSWFNNLKPGFKFVILLSALSILYQYPSIIFKRPQSIHHWRQSDCASFALNYYQTGMHFFQPQTHNLTSDNSTTSYSATSEIPFWYYFIAILYKIFGYHDYIYRGLNTFIFLLGLYYLFKTFYLLLDNFFWSWTITLFFFTSPVLVYYGNNFLTDSSAFAFILIAWYFFLKFYRTNSQRTFYLSMLFFLIAGSFKIFALISLVAIIAVFLAELIGITKFRPDEKLFHKPKLQFIPFIVILFIIGAWAVYAHYFNKLHKSEYFSTSIRTFSLWYLDDASIQKVIVHVKLLWLTQYFHLYSLYLLGALFIFPFFFLKKNNKFLLGINLLLFIGTIIYVILFFKIFEDHDCYTINLYIWLIFIFITSISLIEINFTRIFKSPYIKAIFLLFLIFNVTHARNQMHVRYTSWWSEYPEYKYYHTITPYLRSIGIRPLDTVVCLPDESHFTLYLMNQRGWTACWGNDQDSAGIALSIKRGAKYLIINGDEVLNRNYIKSFLYHPMGNYGNVRIFKLGKRDGPYPYDKLKANK